MLAPRTVRAYAGDWALFTDWCHATGSWELPADPATLVAFLTDCTAAPATLRRRVAAIDHRHTTNGHPPPGLSTVTVSGRCWSIYLSGCGRFIWPRLGVSRLAAVSQG